MSDWIKKNDKGDIIFQHEDRGFMITADLQEGYELYWNRDAYQQLRRTPHPRLDTLFVFMQWRKAKQQLQSRFGIKGVDE